MEPTCEKVYSAAEMRNFRDALYVLNGKWKLPIIQAMAAGHTRFKEIREVLAGISPRALSKELKELEENQLIKKKFHADDFPSWFEYQFTEHSRSLAPVIDLLMQWAESHRELLFREGR